MDLTEAVGFYSWNVQQDKVFGDPVFAYIYGVSNKSLEAGASIADVIRNVEDGDKQRVAKALHETILTGKPCHQTYRISHGNGRRLIVTGQGRCLRDGSGMPSIYTGSVSARDADVSSGDLLESHCIEALKIAEGRRHALAARYLSSALNVIGRNERL